MNTFDDRNFWGFRKVICLIGIHVLVGSKSWYYKGNGYVCMIQKILPNENEFKKKTQETSQLNINKKNK